MEKKRRNVDAVPGDFASCEAAADFWDTHDTTDYPEAFADVEVEVDIRGRRFEVDLDEDVMQLLEKEARKRHTRPGRLASRLLRKDLATAGT